MSDAIEKIPPEKFMLGMMSAFSSLVSELVKSKAIDFDAYVTMLEGVSQEHLRRDDPNKTGKALELIVNYLQTTVPAPSRR